MAIFNKRTYLWSLYIILVVVILRLIGSALPKGAIEDKRLVWVTIFTFPPTVLLLLCLPVFYERKRLSLYHNVTDYIFPYYLGLVWLGLHTIGIGVEGSLANLVEPLLIVPTIAIALIYLRFLLDYMQQREVIKAKYLFLLGFILILVERLIIPSLPE